MKKIKYLIPFLFILSLLSCNEEVDNVSRVTNYVTFQLNGDKDLIVPVGGTYKELGVVAKEGATDVSKDVKIKGEVNTNTIGLYKIDYEAINKDGFPSSITRNVIVAPNTGLSNLDLTGSYNGGRAGAKHQATACTITKIGKGVFKADDFFAGYYNLEKGYGSSYKLEGYFYLSSDNTYKTIGTPQSPWSPMEIQNGKYDPATKTLTNKTFFTKFNFGFDISLTLNKE